MKTVTLLLAMISASIIASAQGYHEVCVEFNFNIGSASHMNCPIELCIIQEIDCHDGSPAAVQTCSILNPNASSTVCYQEMDPGSNCTLTFFDVVATRISTGEQVHLSGSDLGRFESILKGTSEDVVRFHFHLNCDDVYSDNFLAFDSEGGELDVRIDMIPGVH